jgi:hypothetical protein
VSVFKVLPWFVRLAPVRFFLDWTLGHLLNLTWERVSVKHSHFWQWIDAPEGAEPTVFVPQDLNAGDRSKSIFHELWHTNFGWSAVAILEPTTYRGKYRLGFEARESSSTFNRQLCTLTLSEKTAVLQSHVRTGWFGIDLDGNPIQLRVVRTDTTKKVVKSQKITLI